MYRLILLLICSLLPGCAQRGDPAPTTSPVDELSARTAEYRSLAPHNWDVSRECDALLFVSLQQVGLNEPGDVEMAESESGKWNRLPRPDYAAECSSDISRDMLTGVFVWAWEFRRLDVLERMWAYGESHDWVMGEERKPGLQNRVRMLPGTQGLLAELIATLGGESHWERKLLNVTPLSTEAGFQSHLTLLQIHLRGEMHNGLSAGELDSLREILWHMAGNPLAHALLHKYTDGDQSVATNLLLSIWPAGRLPTQRDWSEEWRTQRSDGDTGLQPGDSDVPHSGGDFLFVSRVILGRTHND